MDLAVNATPLLIFFIVISLGVFSVDDYLLVLGHVIYAAYLGCVLEACKHGVGKHVWDAPNLTQALMWTWINQFLWLAVLFIVKLSIVIFFLSLQPPRYLRIIAIGAAWYSVALTIVYATYMISLCRPLPYFWTRLNGGLGECLDTHKQLLVLEVCNTAHFLSDILLAILPWLMVRRMRMTRRKKIVVSLLLGTSTMPAIVSIIRAWATKVLEDDITDFTYAQWIGNVLEIIEPGVAIFVVSVARLRPLVEIVIPATWYSTQKSSQGNKYIASNRPPTFGQRSPRRQKHETDISLDELIEETEPTNTETKAESRKGSHEAV